MIAKSIDISKQKIQSVDAPPMKKIFSLLLIDWFICLAILSFIVTICSKLNVTISWIQLFRVNML